MKGFTHGIQTGDSTEFAFQGKMITVVVYSVGFDKVKAKSGDLEYDFDIPAWKWNEQKKILQNIKDQQERGLTF